MLHSAICKLNDKNVLCKGNICFLYLGRVGCRGAEAAEVCTWLASNSVHRVLGIVLLVTASFTYLIMPWPWPDKPAGVISGNSVDKVAFHFKLSIDYDLASVVWPSRLSITKWEFMESGECNDMLLIQSIILSKCNRYIIKMANMSIWLHIRTTVIGQAT